MRGFAPAMLLLLAACGGAGVKADDVRDPVAQNVAEAAANGTPAAVAAAIDCSNKPDFVPVYAGGQVTTCVSGPDGTARGHVSGTIVYESDADPRRILAWSREQANASGLAQRAATETLYSAGEERARSVMILVEPYQGRTRVTVNWGRAA
jgi:hypothetical protein